MHRGYFKSWRKEIDSAVWRQPPHYYRFWKWLQSKASHAGNAGPDGLPPGSLRTTYGKIKEALKWGPGYDPKYHGPSTIAAMLQWLEDEEMIVRIPLPAEAQGLLIQIVNWDHYQPDEDEHPASPVVPANPPPADPLPGGDLFGDNPHPTPRMRGRRKTKYVPSDQAVRCLQAWEKYRDLPTNPKGEPLTERDTYHKVFDDMHRLDKVPWDDLPDVPGVFARCRWAVTEWGEEHIQSPSKMRSKSRKYPEKKEHEVMATQIRAQRGKQQEQQQSLVYKLPEQDWKK